MLPGVDHLRGGLIVSCQPVTGGPMDRPDIVAAFALAALDGGARGLRIEGIDNLRAVRAVTACPVIGLVKTDLPDSPVRITPHLAQVDALIAAGADIVAFDATDRPRPVPAAVLAARVRAGGALAMADCATPAEGRAAAALTAGADAVVAGSAITRPEHVTAWFVAAMQDARSGAGQAVAR
jgi:N-acylglucosamine-6-phosphate 2-epimerase